MQAHTCTRDSTAKMQLVRSLPTPSCSFTASLRSTNLLILTKKSRASVHASTCDHMCEHLKLYRENVES